MALAVLFGEPASSINKEDTFLKRTLEFLSSHNTEEQAEKTLNPRVGPAGPTEGRRLQDVTKAPAFSPCASAAGRVARRRPEQQYWGHVNKAFLKSLVI